MMPPEPGTEHALLMGPWMSLAAGLVLVLINGFFVAAEFALVKVRPTQVDAAIAQGNRRARVVKSILSRLDGYLSACQLGITLASLALGWVGEPAFSWVIQPLVMRIPGASDALLHTLSLVLAFGVITTLHIVVGEQAPKYLAILKAEVTSSWVAWPLIIFYRVTFPAIWILNHASNSLLRLFGVEPEAEHALGHSEEELRLLLAATKSENLSDQKRNILDNVFELSHRNARQIMIPRADVVYLSTKDSMAVSLAKAKRSGHTRFPLCHGDLDQVVGLIHIKDLWRAEEPLTQLMEASRPLNFVPDTLTLDRLLKRLRMEQCHLAGVLDEYGGVSGVVTMENVIEEIVGEIQDEFDAELPEFVEVEPGVFDIVGRLLVVELEDYLKMEISDRDEDTLAGVILSELGRSPKVGDEVLLGQIRLEVLEATKSRIHKIRVYVPRESSS